MQTNLFVYSLPANRIAQRPAEPRESAKLLVLNRATGGLQDRHVDDLPDLLHHGDLLVFNDSKVFKARLRGRSKKGRDVEVFLLRPLPPPLAPLTPSDSPSERGRTARAGGESTWIALAKPGRNLKLNDTVHFEGGAFAVLKEKRDDGTFAFDFGMSSDDVFALCDRIGEVPVPPYVEPDAVNTSTYQTVYAKTVGSVAAPTAGFHFTKNLLRRIGDRGVVPLLPEEGSGEVGVRMAYVTLHVGLGTFRPIKTKTLTDHVMHEEWAHVPEETAQAIAETKQAEGRVIVVGTTALRALESWALTPSVPHIRGKSNSSPVKGRLGGVTGWSGFTSLFITPGYTFKVADSLITNFHLPKSTLLVLVSAFAGREFILDAYRHAIDNGYRFYSFGDAMLIT